MKITPSTRFEKTASLLKICHNALDDWNVEYAAYMYLHQLLPKLGKLEEDLAQVHEQLSALDTHMSELLAEHEELDARITNAVKQS